MRSNLPAGWKWGKVADIYDAVKTKVDPTSSDIASYIGLEHLSKGGGIESIGSSESLQSIKTVFEAGDVLYGKLRPYLNKHAVVDFGGVCSTDILAFRPKSEYPGQLLNYFLGLPSVIQHANEHSKGINLPRVNAETLLEMEMPIPPTEEANRIVVQLEAIIQKLEVSQERLEKLPVLLKQFRKAVLAAAVTGKLTEAWRAEQPQGKSAEDLLTDIRSERRARWEERQHSKMSSKQLTLSDAWKQKYEELGTPDSKDLPELPNGWLWAYGEVVSDFIDPQPSHRTPPAHEAGIPYIGMGDVDALNQIDFASARKVHPDVLKEHIERYQLKKGDFFFGKIGTIGNPILLQAPFTYTLSANVILVQPHGLMAEGYMYWYMSTPFIKEHFRKFSSATSQAAFGIQKARVIPIAVPSFSEQQEIVRQVNHYFELANQLEARFEQAAAMVEQLPQALLAKAFSGQLVPQDPNDEPASALLERLRATTSSPAKGQRGHKPKVAQDAPLFE